MKIFMSHIHSDLMVDNLPNSPLTIMDALEAHLTKCTYYCCFQCHDFVMGMFEEGSNLRCNQCHVDLL